MAPLTNLPAELLLDILIFLPLHDLQLSLALLSKSHYAFLRTYSDPVFRAAAILHRFAEKNESALDAGRRAKLLSGHSVEKEGWLALCRAWVTLERNWSVHPNATVLMGSFSLPEVHPDNSIMSLYVDEEDQTIVSLSTRQGLCVQALESGRVLFTNACNTNCPFFASDGYILIVENGDPGAIACSVWLSNGTTRGQLERRYQLFLLPGSSVYAFRFPFIATSGHVRGTLHIQDVRNGSIWASIPYASQAESVWSVNASELGLSASFSYDLRFLSLCLPSTVQIYQLPSSDTPSSDVATLQPTAFPSLSMARDSVESMRAAAFRTDSYTPIANTALDATPGEKTVDELGILLTNAVLRPSTLSFGHPCPIHMPKSSDRTASTALVIWGATQPLTPQMFSSACFSPSGRHFAAVTKVGLAYLVSDFERALRLEVSWEAITTRISLGGAPRRIIWEQEERLFIECGNHPYTYVTHVFTLNPLAHGMHLWPILLSTDPRSVHRPPSFPFVHTQIVQTGRRIREPFVHVTRRAIWLYGAGINPITADEEVVDRHEDPMRRLDTISVMHCGYDVYAQDH